MKSVGAAKSYYFKKGSGTRCLTYLIFLWYSAVKLKYSSPNIHHLCFSIITGFPTYSMFALVVANNLSADRQPVLMQMSAANWLLGDGSFTFSSSRRINKSFQQINSLLHLKSCKTIGNYQPRQTYHLLG